MDAAGFPPVNVHAHDTIGSPAAGVELSVNKVGFPSQTGLVDAAATGNPVTLSGNTMVSLHPVWLVTISVTV